MSPSLHIIGETLNYYFIDKPAGIHSVRLPSGGGLSIADYIMQERKAIDISDRPEDAGLLNRLDFDTSGILIAAKNKMAWMAGRELMSQEKIQKSYLILVEGSFPESKFVESYLGSPHRGAKKVKIYRSKPARSARALYGATTFFLVKEFSNLNCSLVRAECSKAQRHQVRAHAAFLGHPLLGDNLYGAKRAFLEVWQRESRNFFLHAERVSFTDPLNGEKINFVAPSPSFLG